MSEIHPAKEQYFEEINKKINSMWTEGKFKIIIVLKLHSYISINLSMLQSVIRKFDGAVVTVKFVKLFIFTLDH